MRYINGQSTLGKTGVMHSIPSHAVDVQDEPKRIDLIRALAAIPGFLEPLKKLVSERGFTVVMSEGNAHLFQANADGIYKPFLREGGKFVENVDLKKMPFDYAGLVANAASQAQMAMVMKKLDTITAIVSRTGNEMRDTNRAKVEGRVTSLHVARELRQPEERRERILSACDDLVTDLTVLAAQLRSSINAMPSEKVGWLDGWSGTRLSEADAAFKDVAADITAIRLGCQTVLGAYAELGETAAARRALSGLMTAMARCDMDALGQRARIVKAAEGAEPIWQQVSRFRQGMTALGDEVGALPTQPALIRFELTATDLETVPL